MPSTNPFQEGLTDGAARAQHYLRSIHYRHVGVRQEALDDLPKLGGALSAQGQDPKSVVKLLDEIGSPATIANMGGRFFGGWRCLAGKCCRSLAGRRMGSKCLVRSTLIGSRPDLD